jgi:hypothetical protein
MAILREREVWKRPPRQRSHRVDWLSPDETANVRKAVEILRAKHGDLKRLARAMGVSYQALIRAMGDGSKPGAGVALRAAKLAGVPVEDVLSGAYAKGWVCPTCGRSG